MSSTSSNPPLHSNHEDQSDEDLDAFLSEIKSMEKEETTENSDTVQKKEHPAKTVQIGPVIPFSPKEAKSVAATPAPSIGPSIPEEFLNRRKRKADEAGISSESGGTKKKRLIHPTMLASGMPVRAKFSQKQLSAKPKIMSETERILKFKETYETMNQKVLEKTTKSAHEDFCSAKGGRHYSSWDGYDPYRHQDYEAIKRNLERDRQEQEKAAAPGNVSILKGTTTYQKSDKKIAQRSFGGETWEDASLLEWPENDYRIFVGNLPPDVDDAVLLQAFSKYKSVAKVHVVYNKKTEEPKGFGFVSFLDPEEYVNALDTMDGEYIGSRMVQLKPSKWKKRTQGGG
uniref:RRM domain-containing protein n=1 Tax=Percolomonas cosmopolitus TaxID=63605 RepID=A0A6U0KRN2_9EUKA